MDWYRIKYTLINYFITDARKRADYMKKYHVYRHIGDNCMIQPRKVPLYPQLISLGDNVWIASNVVFCTHDVIHHMLNNKYNTNYCEHMGCIEIGDNSFVGANSIILSNVKIGKNTIIGAGSIVTHDIEGGVFAGSPAKFICSIEEFIERRKDIFVRKDKKGITKESADRLWKFFSEEHE